jgi:hypothetical protein
LIDGPQYPGLTEEIIQRDLTAELPLWILSCYGPGRDAPEQLFGGPQREQSFEEMRMHYMLGAMNGNPQGAVCWSTENHLRLGDMLNPLSSNSSTISKPYIKTRSNKYSTRSATSQPQYDTSLNHKRSIPIGSTSAITHRLAAQEEGLHLMPLAPHLHKSQIHSVLLL